MNYNQTPYDIKQTLKRGFAYLLIAFPVVLICSTLLTIIKAPLAVILLCDVVVGGGVVLLVWIIHNKIKEKKAIKAETEPKKFDPFKD